METIKTLLLIVLLQFTIFQVNAQIERNNWQLGLRTGPVFNVKGAYNHGGILIGDVDYMVGKKISLGFMPFFAKFQKQVEGDYSNNSFTYAFNLKTKFYFSNSGKIMPYAVFHTGFGRLHTKETYNSSDERKSQSWTYNLGIGGGVNIRLSNKLYLDASLTYTKGSYYENFFDQFRYQPGFLYPTIGIIKVIK